MIMAIYDRNQMIADVSKAMEVLYEDNFSGMESSEDSEELTLQLLDGKFCCHEASLFELFAEKPGEGTIVTDTITHSDDGVLVDKAAELVDEGLRLYTQNLYENASFDDLKVLCHQHSIDMKDVIISLLMGDNDQDTQGLDNLSGI
jgi:hypothetical protein